MKKYTNFYSTMYSMTKFSLFALHYKYFYSTKFSINSLYNIDFNKKNFIALYIPCIKPFIDLIQVMTSNNDIITSNDNHSIFNESF